VRRVIVALIIGVVVLVTLLVTAFGSASPDAIHVTQAPNLRLLPPAHPPQHRAVATYGDVFLFLPISGERVSAIGYHASGDGALALNPLGRQANQGSSRVSPTRSSARAPPGRGTYMLGGDGDTSSALDVGAAPGTDVYSRSTGPSWGSRPSS
jgi:hypothetical protein